MGERKDRDERKDRQEHKYREEHRDRDEHEYEHEHKHKHRDEHEHPDKHKDRDGHEHEHEHRESGGGIITLAHGSGGKAAHELITTFFLPFFDNPILRSLDDQGVFAVDKGRLALTTDTHVVSPLFFRGGDIGRLAVCGTVNDLVVCGARPLYLSAGFVIEEGLPTGELRRVLASMRDAAEEASVSVITADTKVVEKGACDGLFINTAGVGVVPAGVEMSSRFVKPGDRILLSGTIGDHGIAVMSDREGISFETDVRSDCAPLAGMVEAMLAAGVRPHAMRDPTRGGLASTLNEIAIASGVEMEVEEEKIPVNASVRNACELLGFDPLHVANEGKLVAFVPQSDAERALQAMRASKYGESAALIGRVVSAGEPRVFMKTKIGGRRFVDMLVGEQFPRIC